MLDYTDEEDCEALDLHRIYAPVLNRLQLSENLCREEMHIECFDSLSRFDRIVECRIEDMPDKCEFWDGLKRLPIEKLVVTANQSLRYLFDFLIESKTLKYLVILESSAVDWKDKTTLDELLDIVRNSPSIKVNRAFFSLC